MEEKNVRVISLGDIWQAFSWHVIPILLAAAVSVGALYCYARFLRKPMYQSVATLYILRQENGNDYAYTSTDFSLALNVVSDCDYMLKSHAVLDDVIEELDLDVSYKSLSRMISTQNPEGSRVLEVSVETDNPELSKKIVDSVCRIGAEKISAAMGMDQVNVYDYGTLNYRPSNEIGIRRYILVGLAVAALVYIAYLVQLILDDKVKTEEDVHKYLNLSVLGNIPNASAKSVNGKYDHYGKRGRYGRKGKYMYNAQYGRVAGTTAAKGEKDE